MSPVTFFRISLALPIALPILSAPFGVGILQIALAFGGVQYAALASWLFFAIGKQRSAAGIQKLSFLSPLIFVLVQAIGWITWVFYERQSNPVLEWGFEALPIFAVYSLAIGYLYVGIVNAVYLGLRQKGFVRES
ncbi:hypothetical protein [Undibacterium sp.]|uniref:hypothetical protein n=1 Tax=Undibacterium sp. TaxID=1914977 RepID=UPI0025E6BFFC|nr:hypothetical protein [Undibacterium sp.]MCX7219868.1 hypothetical protein [Burkholderiales bacterium]